MEVVKPSSTALKIWNWIAWGTIVSGGAFFALYLYMCLPYFMQPFENQKKAGAAILTRAPDVEKLEALDAAGLRALAPALTAALTDPDEHARRGARQALQRMATRPGAPADLMIPGLLADMEAQTQIPASSARALAALGEEGRAALIAAVNGPGDWAPSAAAFQLGQIKPPALDALPALEEALQKAPAHRRFEFESAISRISGKKRR